MYFLWNFNSFGSPRRRANEKASKTFRRVQKMPSWLNSATTPASPASQSSPRIPPPQPLNLSTLQPLNLSTPQPLNPSTPQPLNLLTFRTLGQEPWPAVLDRQGLHFLHMCQRFGSISIFAILRIPKNSEIQYEIGTFLHVMKCCQEGMCVFPMGFH